MEVGDTFGRWTVISLDAPMYRRHRQVRVRCECGYERDITCSSLTRNQRPSNQCQQCARRQSAAQRFGTKKLPQDIDKRL